MEEEYVKVPSTKKEADEALSFTGVNKQAVISRGLRTDPCAYQCESCRQG